MARARARCSTHGRRRLGTATESRSSHRKTRSSSSSPPPPPPPPLTAEATLGPGPPSSSASSVALSAALSTALSSAVTPSCVRGAGQWAHSVQRGPGAGTRNLVFTRGKEGGTEGGRQCTLHKLVIVARLPAPSRPIPDDAIRRNAYRLSRVMLELFWGPPCSWPAGRHGAAAGAAQPPALKPRKRSRRGAASRRPGAVCRDKAGLNYIHDRADGAAAPEYGLSAPLCIPPLFLPCPCGR